MDLTLYKQAATPERIDKTAYLTQVGTVSGVTIKNEMDLMQPVFVLKTDPLVYNANYLYCSFTSRYYYITDITALTGGRVAISCRVDVLYTYKDEILASSAWVVSSSSASDAADYDMLHNDYPWQADYDILGADLTEGEGWRSPFDSEFMDPAARCIYLVVK